MSNEDEMEVGPSAAVETEKWRTLSEGKRQTPMANPDGEENTSKSAVHAA